MVAIPVQTPVTTPVDDMVAIDVLLLLHVPPGVLFDNVVVCATHTESVPELPPMAETTFTVLVVVAVPQAVVTV
jgi:hypothetical protein